nr:MAG TPA: hypothetical protein [Caudoviricetes sp.]
MLKKTYTYKDYNEVERTETFYFHFTEAEILDMEMSAEGGFAERVQRIIDAKDQAALMRLIKKFVIDAYGVKSDDGKRFIKNDEVKTAFLECPAFSDIFMDMVTNDELAAEFVNGVIPDTMKKRFAEIAANKDNK